ncbi:MAG: ATPase [Polaromonas sp. 39-63-203]|jgi:predicted ATPase|uniref:AAA family ATPase n=1 Tax=Polaromonas sp. TaxID=1869339 RepID=UPI000BDCE9A1|nr:AAA family ATPase [Polaromonas sp.]OYY53774.1 MAG: ATPase [Polaromonas sp. 35-63-240]OYZ02401.1 MAG: ATPase [Polaromonas sp. 28-63-22]OYZ84792.1 MAG: ATPase [Polaromonas sp. 24-62-144]OZB01106.1 MAG: ATPase [Polaromonas sp. 39-63-203]HQS30775.1 AAA family ATPase [Polaromonas sp.]
MAILEGIRIQNYRSLKDVTFGKTFENQEPDALPRLMAVIGANGVGKSTLLDVFGFIGDCLNDGVEAACDRPHRGGFERLRTLGASGPIQFEIRYRQAEKQRPISYSLHIDLDTKGRATVVYERLRQRRLGKPNGQPYSFLELTHGSGFAWSGEEVNGVEGRERSTVAMSDRQVLGISTLGTLVDHPRISQFRSFLSGWYLSYFVPELARAQPMAGAEPHLNRRGDNLAKYLQFIERQQPAKFKKALDWIATKVPGLQAIGSVKAPDGRLLLEFHATGYDKPFYQQDMSDGSLKLLAYMLLMEDPDPAPFIGIEEPENGLHHQLLSLLATELQAFALQDRGPQVLVTTHSPNFVDALTPAEVWVLSKGADGYSGLTRSADLPGVQALFDEGILMGSQWYSNHLGIGNP